MLPHGVALPAKLFRQLRLHIAGFLEGHGVKTIVKVQPQTPPEGFDVPACLAALLVLQEALLGGESGHTDIETCHFRIVLGIRLTKPPPGPDRRIQFDNVHTMVAPIPFDRTACASMCLGIHLLSLCQPATMQLNIITLPSYWG